MTKRLSGPLWPELGLYILLLMMMATTVSVIRAGKCKYFLRNLFILFLMPSKYFPEIYSYGNFLLICIFLCFKNKTTYEKKSTQHTSKLCNSNNGGFNYTLYDVYIII